MSRSTNSTLKQFLLYDNRVSNFDMVINSAQDAAEPMPKMFYTCTKSKGDTISTGVEPASMLVYITNIVTRPVIGISLHIV